MNPLRINRRHLFVYFLVAELVPYRDIFQDLFSFPIGRKGNSFFGVVPGPLYFYRFSFRFQQRPGSADSVKTPLFHQGIKATGWWDWAERWPPRLTWTNPGPAPCFPLGFPAANPGDPVLQRGENRRLHGNPVEFGVVAAAYSEVIKVPVRAVVAVRMVPSVPWTSISVVTGPQAQPSSKVTRGRFHNPAARWRYPPRSPSGNGGHAAINVLGKPFHEICRHILGWHIST